MTKAFTDIEQSKKLAKILPPESADMWYDNDGESIAGRPEVRYCSFIGLASMNIPCWSLAALLNYLREIDFFPEIDANEFSVTMNINYYDETNGSLLVPIHNIKVKAESFIDACYEMIIKLNEQKLL